MRIQTAVRLAAGFAVLVSLAAPAAAQTATHGVLLGGGFSFLAEEETPMGFAVNVVSEVKPFTKVSLGVVGDFGYHTAGIDDFGADISVSLMTVVGGVRLTSTAAPAVTPFGQFLIGGGRIAASAEFDGEAFDDSVGGFVIGGGGGVNIRLNDRVNFLAQIDLLHFDTEVEGIDAGGTATRVLLGISVALGR